MILCFCFAAVLSLDAFSFGFVSGISATKVPFFSRLIITAVSVFYAFAAIAIGDFFTDFLSGPFENAIGGILLILTGCGVLIKTLLFKDDSNCGECVCTAKEALFIGFALSVDMLGAGTGYAIGDGLPLYFPLVAGFAQFVMLCGGIFFGKLGGRFLGAFRSGFAKILSPILIIAIGIISFFR